MKTWMSVIALACCAAFAVGCEDDSSSGTTPAADTAAGTDAAASTDDTATAGTDAAGGCPAAYEMPATNPGCTSDGDKAFFTSLQNDAALTKQFTDIVRNCTLNKGCLAKTCESDKVKCISECIEKDLANAASYQCSYCYGLYSGYCGFKKCLAVCAVDSPDCAPCLAENCDGKRDACRDTGANPGL